MSAVYAFIAEEKADPNSPWSVAEMCRVLEVSRSGFYDWEARTPSQRHLTDRLLAGEIEAIWETSARTHRHTWPTRQAVRTAVVRWIEGWYNARRLHSSNAYLSPIEKEANYHHLSRKAA